MTENKSHLKAVRRIEALRPKPIRLVDVVHHVPMALAAAAGAFLDTLMRPEPPASGSADDLAQFGLTPELFLEALQMFMDTRAVRPGKLRHRFGNAMGTNLLSMAEIRGFISKPERGPWQVDFERIQDYRSRQGVRQE